jgi:hypothetical protein
VDEKGLDAENSPFLWYKVVRQSWRRNWSRKVPINEGFSGGKPHPMEK